MADLGQSASLSADRPVKSTGVLTLAAGSNPSCNNSCGLHAMAALRRVGFR
jgi:hypothetical protein